MKERFNRRILRDETKEDWAARFYEAAARSGTLYRTAGHGLIYIDSCAGPRRVMSDNDFFGIANSTVEAIEVKLKDGEEYTSSVFLTTDETRTLFAHPAKDVLPEVVAVVTEPAVVPSERPGHYKVLERGYNRGSRIFYYVPAHHNPIPPKTGVFHLSRCFEGVPFETPMHRNNLLAWLLGGVCLDPRVNPPLLVVTGNQQGIGKTSCVQAVGRVLTGGDTSPISQRGGGDEFGKQISAKFVENERIIFLDNIVTPQGRSFDNPQLSALLTQGFSKKVRVLGHSRSVSSSGVLFAASLNDAKLSTDLADRSLVVKLFREKNCPMTPYCLDYAVENRDAIYGELLGLALGDADGHCLKFPTFRFRGWLDFVYPRIVPLFGELGLAEGRSVDDLTQELFSLGFEVVGPDATSFDAKEFLLRITTRQGTYPALEQKFLSIISEKNRVISAGRYLAARCGDSLAVNQETTVRLICTKERDKTAAEYKFEVVQ